MYNKNLNHGIVKIVAQIIDYDLFSPYKIHGETEVYGSGFFIDLDGHILTCAHVIEHSIKIYVMMPESGKKKIEASLISVSFDKDIALLQIKNYKNKYFYNLGDSDKIQQGDEVIAIGYPLAQDNSKITTGVISGRTNRYIQTDAPINEGNSGGALFNKNMEVIGINTSKITNAEGICFALPIQEFFVIKSAFLSNFINKTNKTNKTNIIYEPQMLYKGMNSDESLFSILKYNGKGYFMKKIYTQSPFYSAGMRSGDILTSFNNIAVDNHGECIVTWTSEKVHINDLITRFTPDTSIKITYWSYKGGNKSAEIKLNFGNVYKIKNLYPPFEPLDYEIIGGIVIMELSVNHILSVHKNKNIPKKLEIKLESYYEPKNRFENVLFISDILNGSYISTLTNIDVGEIITKINGKDVKTLHDLRNIVKNNIIINKKSYTVIQTVEDTIIVIDQQKYNAEKTQLYMSHKIIQK